MAVIRKSITFTSQQVTYMKSLVEKGLYTNDSEYIRDIIRKDQEAKKEAIDLHDALLEGLNSGQSNATIGSIWKEALDEVKEESGSI